GRHATLHNSPIHFIHGSVDFTDLCALYVLAEVAMVTPLIDGMNLVAKEFVAAQRENPGVLVLSEFAGAAEELLGSLVVNPNDAVHALLETLARRDNIATTIISGRTPNDLESFLGRYPFGLIAEHGASLRPPRQREWEQLDRNISYAWKEELLKVLRLYEAST